MTELIQLDIKGDNPSTHAQRILQQYAENEAIKSVSLKITSADFSETGMNQKTTEDYDLASDSDDEVAQTDKEHKTAEEREAEKEAKREKGNIKAGTSHHHVLAMIAKLSNGNMVPAREIKDSITEVSESSIYPALTKLWERRLADRERVEDVANPYYKYELTDWGRQKLEDLGEPITEDE